jgi:hypothetical protein
MKNHPASGSTSDSQHLKAAAVAMSVVAVEMAASPGARQAGLTGLAVDTESPVAAADVLGVTLARGAADGLLELLGSNELVTAVALTTVLSTREKEASALAVSDASLVGDGTNVGADDVGEGTLVAILEAASKLESANGTSGVAACARGSLRVVGSRSDGHGLPDGVDLGAAAGCGCGCGRGSGSGGRLGGLRSRLLGLLLNGLLRLRGDGGLRGNSGLSLSLLGRRVRDGRVLDNVGRSFGRLGQTSFSGAGRRGLRRRASIITGVGDGQRREVVETEAPALQGVVTGESAKLAANLLVNLGRNRAVLLVDTIEEALAVIHAGSTSIAGINDVLEELLVPASQEVGVRGETSGVTVGKNEGLLANAGGPATIEERSVPVDLEEQVRNMDPALRAVNLAIIALGVGHVVLVVGQASLGVVARWEVNVGTQGRGITIAAHVGETNTLALVDGVAHTRHGAIRVGRPGGGVVVVSITGASPLDGLDGALGRIQVRGRGLWGSSPHGITSDDLQASGEGLDLIIGSLEEVVGVDVKDLDGLKGVGLFVVEVHTGEPVVGVVALDLSVGALGVDGILASGARAEGTATHDGVNVRRRLARGDDGIHTTCSEPLVGETEDGEGALVLGGDGGDEGCQSSAEGELHGEAGCDVACESLIDTVAVGLSCLCDL